MKNPDSRDLPARRAQRSLWVLLLHSFGCGALFSGPLDAPAERADIDWIDESPHPTSHVVLVMLDGVRPRDVLEGAETSRLGAPRSARDLVPNLTAMRERGLTLGDTSRAHVFEASGPNFVSLPGYTEVFSGATSVCQRNDCGVRPERTFIDALLDAGVEGRHVAVMASWDGIENALSVRASREVVTTFGRTAGTAHEARGGGWVHAATRAVLEDPGDDPRPGHGDYRPDARTAKLALAHLRRSRPAFLFLGLGDTDELAHAGDYAGYLDALHEADHVIGELRALASDWTLRGEPTTLIVTTDHGRGDEFSEHGAGHPASRAVWLVAEGSGLDLDARAVTKLADVSTIVLGALRSGPSSASYRETQANAPQIPAAISDQRPASSRVNVKSE